VDQDEKHFKILELSADVRKFEIGLFWTRSLFFWGFSTLIITAYGAAHYATEDVRFAIACVGIICSVVWTLVNRSSKYWQREWELKAAHAALTATGKKHLSGTELAQEPQLVAQLADLGGAFFGV
jgi:hypothetical protein